MDQSEDQIFDDFLSAAGELMVERLHQDPNVGIDVQREQRRIRGLVTYEDGQPVWWPFEVEIERLRKDGPEAVAYDFIEGLTEVRKDNPLQ